MANLEFMQVPRDPAPDHVAMSYKRAWQERRKEPGAARRQPGSGRALERPASDPTDGATIMASVGPFQGPICPFLGRLVYMVCQATDERLASDGSPVGWLTVRPTGGPPTLQGDPRSGDGNPAPHGRRAS